MDDLRDQYHDGRHAMIDAFAALTMLALRAGADEDAVSALHGRFFDGKVEMENALRPVFLLAAMYRDTSG